MGSVRRQRAHALGIFAFGELARYQSIVTRKTDQRRGIVRRLLYESARHAIHRLGARDRLIICAAGTPAIPLYESLGFETCEKQAGLVHRTK